MRVVISQSMLFPWVGLLEQVRLADVFVHYDDVQFSKGSFVNRVQLKMPDGVRWMTVPLAGVQLGQRIDEVRIQPVARWREQHLALLRRSFADAPHAQDALALAEQVYAQDHASLAHLARASLLALVHYFGLDAQCRFADSADLGVGGSSSERVLRIVQHLGGRIYVTGHGAARYLDHAWFEREGVEVAYMAYRRQPYPQSHGPFNPHVSGLDLVAHCGRAGLQYIQSNTVAWREFLNESE